ncbi:hypothetical protein D7X96_04255 [Corallococcus interemptor]|uniref:Carboxypeptidase regulatory-like domain-containing protein n=2 Tax=Corallococcus interemptor TaxID=2316720 RepID=A0A3A8R5V5_9BACT|nr:hypothetical protein D7X96_04255 [Corallococcus interemptor]
MRSACALDRFPVRRKADVGACWNAIAPVDLTGPRLAVEGAEPLRPLLKKVLVEQAEELRDGASLVSALIRVILPVPSLTRKLARLSQPDEEGRGLGVLSGEFTLRVPEPVDVRVQPLDAKPVEHVVRLTADANEEAPVRRLFQADSVEVPQEHGGIMPKAPGDDFLKSCPTVGQVFCCLSPGAGSGRDLHAASGDTGSRCPKEAGARTAVMRKWLIGGVAVLVACGLVLFWALRSRGPAAPERTDAPVASNRTPSPGTAHPESVDGGLLPTQRAPSKVAGILDVEVLSGGKPSLETTVRLYAPGERASAWTLMDFGLTDAAGHVLLASGPGRYLVSVRAPGRAPMLRAVVRPLGESRTAVSIALEPAQSLTGRTVVRGTNEPLPLVEIALTAHGRELETWEHAEAPEEERVYATSDERGNFRIDGLAPGTYLLEARAPGYARVVLSRLRIPTDEPLTLALRLASVIEGFVVDSKGQPAADAEVQVGGNPSQVVTTGAQGGFSVEVEPGSHPLSARRGEESGSLDLPVLCVAGSTVRGVRIQLGPGAVLEGQVVEEAGGAPVADARIEATLSGMDAASGVAMSDAEGHFIVQGLAPGSYDAKVTALGYEPVIRRGLTLTQGERFPVDFKLSGTCAVEGHVRDRNGAPVAAAHITVHGWSEGMGMSASPIDARTDADGYYRVVGLAAGRLAISARRDGTMAGTLETVAVEANRTARMDFTLEGSGTIEGRVRAARDSLKEGRLGVTAVIADRFATTPLVRGDVSVSGEGVFRMTIPAGEYKVLLAERGRFIKGKEEQVRVEPGRTVQVEFTWEEPPAERAYRGVVLEPDGSPSPRAIITLTMADGLNLPMAMLPTDEEGRFAIPVSGMEDATSNGRLMLGARNGGRSCEPVPVTPEKEVVLRLKPAAFLRGRVVRKGEPVRGFTLTLQLQKGFLPEGKATGPLEFSGDRFELRDVPPEPVMLTARTLDGSVGEATASPGTGAVLEVDIPLKAPATVRGRVVSGPTKTPVSSAFISFENEPPSPNRASNAEGRFTLDGVRAGERILFISGGPSHGQRRLTLKLKEGEVLDLGDVALEVPTGSPTP